MNRRNFVAGSAAVGMAMYTKPTLTSLGVPHAVAISGPPPETPPPHITYVPPTHTQGVPSSTPSVPTKTPTETPVVTVTHSPVPTGTGEATTVPTSTSPTSVATTSTTTTSTETETSTSSTSKGNSNHVEISNGGTRGTASGRDSSEITFESGQTTNVQGGPNQPGNVAESVAAGSNSNVTVSGPDTRSGVYGPVASRPANGQTTPARPGYLPNAGDSENVWWVSGVGGLGLVAAGLALKLRKRLQ